MRVIGGGMGFQARVASFRLFRIELRGLGGYGMRLEG
jgi:hypothetical protein